MLYIVATPIGNMDEITLRALEVLKSVELVCAEDTRHTRILFERHGIKTPMTAYHKFNEKESVDGLIEKLKSGMEIALVSDAGMPLISDPGAVLVSECVKNEVPYTVISGASAAVDAAVLSGLDTRAYLTAGFLPEKKSDKRAYISKFASLEATLVFYSSVHNVKEDIALLGEELGDRPLVVVREISKLHESVNRGSLLNPPEFVEKGEFVLVIGGAPSIRERLGGLSIEEHLKMYLDVGEDKNEVIKRVAKERGVAKSEVYKVALTLKIDKR